MVRTGTTVKSKAIEPFCSSIYIIITTIRLMLNLLKTGKLSSRQNLTQYELMIKQRILTNEYMYRMKLVIIALLSHISIKFMVDSLVSNPFNTLLIYLLFLLIECCSYWMIHY